MRKMEVFFDYSCPFCLTGHEYLVEVIKQHQDIEIIWRPCEAHPRPEEYHRYSDLCVQGLFYALEQNVDIWDFHMKMYNAACKDGIDIEDPVALSNVFRDMFDPAGMVDAIKSGRFEKSVLDANDYTYEENDVWCVPAFRLEGRKLDAVGGVGISKKELEEFLK